MSATDTVRALVQPIIEQHGAELYDLEYESGILQISIDRDGGIDVDAIGELSRLISDELDRVDPIPDSKYMLEVSSPGVERKLRTPDHFRKQVGETIAVKLRVAINGARRLQAVVVSADDDGIELEGLVESETIPTKLSYSDIDSARSVYDWAALSSPKSKTGGDTRIPKVKPEKADAKDKPVSQKKSAARKKLEQ